MWGGGGWGGEGGRRQTIRLIGQWKYKVMVQMMLVEVIFFEMRFKLGFVLRADVKFRELESLVNSNFFSPLVHLSGSNFLDLTAISCV